MLLPNTYSRFLASLRESRRSLADEDYRSACWAGGLAHHTRGSPASLPVSRFDGGLEIELRQHGAGA